MDKTPEEDESIVTRLKRRSNAKQLDFKHLLKKCSSSDCDCHQQHTPKATTDDTSSSTASRSLRSRPSATNLVKEEPAPPKLPPPPPVPQTGKKIRCQVQGKNVLVDESDFNKYIRHGKWQSGEFFRYELQSKFFF